jgi:BirA family transcriptional regulator, biotin operon repressor / biotin---[acetyl-CoA-carboxylase] ligase
VPQIALVAGAAVAAAVSDEVGRRAAIKWPNDVLLDGRKVAGILTEMESEVERVHHVACGIGVNLNAPLRSFPPELRDKAGSLLACTGRRVERCAFVARLLAALEARYERYLQEGFASVRAEWNSYSCLTGAEVAIAASDGEQRGRVVGLDADGALRLRTPAGEARIVAGEVTVREGYRR